MKRIVEYLVLAAILIGVPFVFCWWGGDEMILGGLGAFPPRTEDWAREATRMWPKVCPFNWFWFLGMAAWTLAVLFPFARRMVRVLKTKAPPRPRFRFPWWGYPAVLALIGFWSVAWAWKYLLSFRPHTYTPLWFAAIFTFNALAKWRSGRCPLTDRPLLYLASFPVSSLFWWFFEYLNRFVWNWYYVETSTMRAWPYVLVASFCFSTVLPGIWAMAELLGTFRIFDDRNFDGMAKVNFRSPVSIAVMAALSVCGLVGIVFRPQYFYLLLWVSPLMAFVLVQRAFRESSALDALAEGRWGLVFRFAIAALCCGFCWELWNSQSTVKWIYNVPYVHGFKIFEMPLIGFAGYLPFGIEAAAILHWMGAFRTKSK